MLVMDICVCAFLENTESPSVSEYESLGGINTEFVVIISAAGQRSFFKILSRFPRAQSCVLSEEESRNSFSLQGKNLPSPSYCSRQ